MLSSEHDTSMVTHLRATFQNNSAMIGITVASSWS